MANIENVKIGACAITFDGDDLGHTKGGVEVTIETEKVEITVDETGNTIRDYSLLGQKMKVKVALAESQIANLGIAIPMGESLLTGTKLKIGQTVGERYGDHAAQLSLRPFGETTAANDIVLYKAIVADDVTINYTNDDQRVVEVTFEALYDETNTGLGHFGVTA